MRSFFPARTLPANGDAVGIEVQIVESDVADFLCANASIEQQTDEAAVARCRVPRAIDRGSRAPIAGLVASFKQRRNFIFGERDDDWFFKIGAIDGVDQILVNQPFFNGPTIERGEVGVNVEDGFRREFDRTTRGHAIWITDVVGRQVRKEFYPVVTRNLGNRRIIRKKELDLFACD